MDTNDKIGARIRYIRELNHFTREELAEYSDISTKFLYEVECGKKGMSAYNIARISDALGVSTDYLLKGKNEVKCNLELVSIIESFDATQIPMVMVVLKALLEVSR